MGARGQICVTVAVLALSGIVAISARGGGHVPPSRPPQSSQDVQLRSYLDEAAQAMRRGDNVSAERVLRQALRIDSRSVPALNNLGIVLARLGRPAEAIPFYREALRLRPDPATERNLAIAYFKTEKYSNAWSLLRPMAMEPSADFQLLDLAGLCLFALDRYPDAAGYLE